VFEHADSVGKCESFGLVMGDVDGGGAGLSYERCDLETHPLAQVCVEIGKRLVAQDQADPAYQRASKSDALLLPARELTRIAVTEEAETDAVEHVARLDSSLPGGDSVAPKREGDVLEDRQVGPERIVLEDHRESPALGSDVRASVCDGPLTDDDTAGGDAFDARDQA
jgi:hypothetical protein